MDRTEDTVAPSADRLLVRYRVRSDAGRIEARAAALALEQSVEMPAEAITDQAIRANVPGRVEGIRALPREAPATAVPGDDTAVFEVEISLAASTVGDEPGQLLNMLFGNCSLQDDVRLVDARLPDSLLAALPGPAFGIDGLRAACGAGARSISSRGKASRASTAWPRKLPANGVAGQASRVQITTCGPMIAAASPPIMIREIALGRSAGATASDAAKR